MVLSDPKIIVNLVTGKLADAHTYASHPRSSMNGVIGNLGLRKGREWLGPDRCCEIRLRTSYLRLR